MNEARDVYYIFSNDLLKACSRIPNLRSRGFLVTSLISSYGLLEKCKISLPTAASEEDIRSFHSADYIDLLKKADKSTDLEALEIEDSENIDNFNLGYDCPLFSSIYEFAKLICGGTLTAVKILTKNKEIIRDDALKREISQPKSYLKYRLKTSEDSQDIFDFASDDCIVQPRTPKQVKSFKKPKLDSNVIKINNSNVVINWQGGWHHAQSDSAEGFCYVNDIVIGILHLLKYFDKVLYIDLDIHHGNGVENAFSSSKRVLTFSIHKMEPGYYPCTGGVEDIGLSGGTYHSVNIPLKDGASNETFCYVFEKILNKINTKFKASCIVVQCGADCMAGDPLGGFNLTPKGLGHCLKLILNMNLPTLVLGGGGYNAVNVARCWTYLTSIILNQEISNDIPDTYKFFSLCGPDFQLDITPTLRKDCNSKKYIDKVITDIYANLDEIPNKETRDT